jgi:hypothetical protein
MRTVRSLKNLGKMAVVPTPAVAPTPLPVRVKAPVAPAMAMDQVKVLGRA